VHHRRRTGEHDRFLPPRRLAQALRRAMGLELRSQVSQEAWSARDQQW